MLRRLLAWLRDDEIGPCAACGNAYGVRTGHKRVHGRKACGAY